MCSWGMLRISLEAKGPFKDNDILYLYLSPQADAQELPNDASPRRLKVPAVHLSVNWVITAKALGCSLGNGEMAV